MHKDFTFDVRGSKFTKISLCIYELSQVNVSCTIEHGENFSERYNFFDLSILLMHVEHPPIGEKNMEAAFVRAKIDNYRYIRGLIEDVVAFLESRGEYAFSLHLVCNEGKALRLRRGECCLTRRVRRSISRLCRCKADKEYLRARRRSGGG
jgi:hypothetical protein